jgi:hypothetical protein
VANISRFHHLGISGLLPSIAQMSLETLLIIIYLTAGFIISALIVVKMNDKGGEREKMPDTEVFKVQRLTEGGYVTFAPEYSQYSETLDLAYKRLQVQVDANLKASMEALKKEANPVPITGGPPRKP